MATTQKITGVLRKAGFKAQEWVTVREGNVRRQEKIGDYKVYKYSKNIQTLEATADKTESIVTELINAGFEVKQVRQTGIWAVR